MMRTETVERNTPLAEILRELAPSGPATFPTALIEALIDRMGGTK
jgi:hypothetical protein